MRRFCDSKLLGLTLPRYFFLLCNLLNSSNAGITKPNPLNSFLVNHPILSTLSSQICPTCFDSISIMYQASYGFDLINSKCLLNNGGSTYLSKLDEIGISINEGYEFDQIAKTALKLLIKLNPRKRYLANVSPKDIRLQEFFLKSGFTGFENVYEMKK